jgi:hypothetical protein
LKVESILFIYVINYESPHKITMATCKFPTGTSSNVSCASGQAKRGMVLPFQPLSLAFNHVNYYVDMPAVSQTVFLLSRQSFKFQGLESGSVGQS